MSVVVNMPMPENCSGCSMKVDPDNRQCVLDGHVFEETFDKLFYCRDKDCPIFCSLPEKHGRLVDADAFLEDVDKALNDGLSEIVTLSGKQIFADLMGEVKEHIEERDTIVPAEGSEDDTTRDSN